MNFNRQVSKLEPKKVSYYDDNQEFFVILGSDHIHLSGVLDIQSHSDLAEFAQLIGVAWTEVENNKARARAILEGKEAEV